LSSDGEKWYKRRKMITPTFHFEILRNHYKIMDEQARVLVQILSDETQKEKTVELSPFLKNCSLDIICGIPAT
jgi:cytochrome P450